MVEAAIAPGGGVAVQVPFAWTTVVVLAPFEKVRVTVLYGVPVPVILVDLSVRPSVITGASSVLL
ncbi:TPA: hypothetical protein U2B60_001614 [Streptococcus suis]|nr:hypothetical protein [Streptococcus suis]HEM6039143.1 hypothetical protein [Streptococcus suis]